MTLPIESSLCPRTRPTSDNSAYSNSSIEFCGASAAPAAPGAAPADRTPRCFSKFTLTACQLRCSNAADPSLHESRFAAALGGFHKVDAAVNAPYRGNSQSKQRLHLRTKAHERADQVKRHASEVRH